MNKEFPKNLKMKAQETSEGRLKELEAGWGDLGQVTLSKCRDKGVKAKIHLS